MSLSSRSSMRFAASASRCGLAALAIFVLHVLLSEKLLLLLRLLRAAAPRLPVRTNLPMLTHYRCRIRGLVLLRGRDSAGSCARAQHLRHHPRKQPGRANLRRPPRRQPVQTELRHLAHQQRCHAQHLRRRQPSQTQSWHLRRPLRKQPGQAQLWHLLRRQHCQAQHLRHLLLRRQLRTAPRTTPWSSSSSSRPRSAVMLLRLRLGERPSSETKDDLGDGLHCCCQCSCCCCASAYKCERAGWAGIAGRAGKSGTQ